MRNEIGEVHIATLETKSKLVANLLLVKWFRTLITFYCFRKFSITYNYNDNIKVTYFADSLDYYPEKVMKKGTL